MADDLEGAPDRQARILDAVVALLARGGIAAVSMRAVAREAGVALGLVGYYFDDKSSLIRAVLLRFEEQDVALVVDDPTQPAEQHLLTVLRRVGAPHLLTTEYLALRLHLWSLSQANEEFARINCTAQKKYRRGLARLIQRARPDLSRAECNRRAADIDVVQNGLWLTSLLGLDNSSQRRALARCEQIALAP